MEILTEMLVSDCAKNWASGDDTFAQRTEKWFAHEIWTAPLFPGIYLAESEQRSCALAAATSFNGILCTAAGGYLVERLPDCTPETMAHMERNLAKLVEMNGDDGEALPTNLMLEGKTPVDIAAVLLDGLGMEALGSTVPTLKCECSEEKLVRSLRLLPREEVDSILKEEGRVDARCEFCGKVYRLGPEEVERRLREAKGDASKDDEWEEEQRERAQEKKDDN